MNKSEAKGWAREHYEVTQGVCRSPYYMVEVMCEHEGSLYKGAGFAKYNPGDKARGLPWSTKMGYQKAQGRAIADLVRALVAHDSVGRSMRIVHESWDYSKCDSCPEESLQKIAAEDYESRNRYHGDTNLTG